MTAHAGGDMNRLIRQASGRSAPRREPDAPGDVGIGKGAGAAPTRGPSRSEQINASLRDAFGVVRGRITFDDLGNA